MASIDAPPRDKARFFRQLEAISTSCQGDDDDEDEFHEAEERLRQQLKAFEAAAQPREPLQEKTQPEPSLQSPVIAPRPPQSDLGRTSFAPVPVPLTELRRRETVIERTPLAEIKGPGRRDQGTASAADSSFVEDTPIPDSSVRPPLQPLPTLPRSMTTPLPASRRLLQHRVDNSPSVTAMKKRKREAAVKALPEDQQMFRGLRFHFIPNDDVAPARKIRIRKAQEYGAAWSRTPEDATHIIVDKRLTWENIEAILRSTEGAAAYVIVNEEYPLDCIRFKALLNAAQKQYRVFGCPEQLSSPPAPQTAEAPAPSLQDRPLKSRHGHRKGWHFMPPLSTPSRSQESSGLQSNGEPGADSSSILKDITPNTHPAVVRVLLSQVVDNADHADTIALHGPAQKAEDELENVISQMQQFKDLPLEHDETDGLSNSSDLTESESDEEVSQREQKRNKRATTKTNRGRKDLAWGGKFACQKGGTKGGDQTNPNRRTIEVLQDMCDYYTRTNDTWRPIAYRKAITQLKRQPEKISTAAEAIQLPGIGQRLADKIEEIVTTDRLKRLEHAESEPMDEILQSFLKIYGVGSAQASHWVAQGFRTLDDLKEKAKLTTNQRFGIDHYDDLNTRIPRSEMELLATVVRSEAAKLDPAVQLIIGGSYRRGADDSGDIDFLITRKGTKSTAELISFLNQLVGKLEAQEFLVARLASSRDEADGSKWHGCCVLPKIQGFNDENYQKVWRRVDFLLVPETEIGAALLYFTGNDIFNRSIRLLASTRGMRLNQRGLYKDVMRGPGRVKVTEGELVEGRDEKKIFEILGVKWREPHERWC